MKTNRWKVKLPTDGRGVGTVILFNGKNITDDLKHILIEGGTEQHTEVTVTFARNIVDVEFETEER